jgi:hypothetical protein
MLRWHTLVRMKKENTLGQKREKSKVDKNNDITIVFFLSDYIVRPFTIKNARLWSITKVSNIFWEKESSSIKKKKQVPIIYLIYLVKEK